MGFFDKLKNGLTKTKKSFDEKINNVFSNFRKVDEELLEDMKGSFKHKFAKKPEVIEGNMKALEIALKEVEKV